MSQGGRDRNAWPDERLLQACRKGDETAYEALAERYKDAVRREAAKFFATGNSAENADLIQEGMIGLYNAVMSYQPDKKASFRTFAMLVIRRRIMNAVTAGRRKKHEPLNDYISIDRPMDESGGGQGIELPADEEDTNPETIALEQEAAQERRELDRRFERSLSPLELQVLQQLREGLTITKIAKQIGRTEKSVDNARTRIKNKWKTFLVEKDSAQDPG